MALLLRALVCRDDIIDVVDAAASRRAFYAAFFTAAAALFSFSRYGFRRFLSRRHCCQDILQTAYRRVSPIFLDTLLVAAIMLLADVDTPDTPFCTYAVIS